MSESALNAFPDRSLQRSATGYGIPGFPAGGMSARTERGPYAGEQNLFRTLRFPLRPIPVMAKPDDGRPVRTRRPVPRLSGRVPLASHQLCPRGSTSAHLGDHGVDGERVGVDVGGGAVADALEDERSTADEFNVAVSVGGLQSSAEFVEEGADLCGGEFSAGHAWPGCVRG